MNTETQTEYTLDQIVEGSFDFSDYPQEEQASLIEETSQMLIEASLMRILDASDEAAQDAFGAFIETEPSQESMLDYIGKNFPTFNQVIIEEIKVLKSLGEQAEADAAKQAEAESETETESE